MANQTNYYEKNALVLHHCVCWLTDNTEFIFHAYRHTNDDEFSFANDAFLEFFATKMLPIYSRSTQTVSIPSAIEYNAIHNIW